MRVPGSNLCRYASKLIFDQDILYFRFLSRETNEAGELVSVFDAPITVRGSFQANDKSVTRNRGLDYFESDATVYIDFNIIGPERDTAGDQLSFGGKRYKVDGETDHIATDGWKRLLITQINYP